MRFCDLTEKEVINVCDCKCLGNVHDLDIDECVLVSHFANQQACTDHSHDNNSRGKNPSRYHNRAKTYVESSH